MRGFLHLSYLLLRQKPFATQSPLLHRNYIQREFRSFDYSILIRSFDIVYSSLK